MNRLITSYQTHFQLKSSLWISATGGSLILPFAIYYLFNQAWGLGFGAMFISLGLFLGTWTCYKKSYNSVYTFVLLTPFSIFYVAYLTNTVGISGTNWCYPTVLLFYFMMSERQAWISTLVFVCSILPLAWPLLETHQAIRLSVTLILVSSYAAIFLNVITRQYKKLSRQATTDSLTGLYNRTTLKESLEQAVQQTNRTKEAYTLISMDIDHFKLVNDELGHDVGDHVLVELGAFLKCSFRETDKVFRTGGEEFLILVYDAQESKAITIAEKLRAGIENLALIPNRKVTVSIGVAGLKSEKDWVRWMKTCDNNLYKAKHSGRNKVVACSV